MKEIIALIRPGKARTTKQKLAELGFTALTEQRVLGRGRQAGLYYPETSSPSGPWGIPFLPKTMLTLFVPDSGVEQVVNLVIQVNRSPEIGDGKIFVLPVGEALRIRTDERGLEAIAPKQENVSYASL